MTIYTASPTETVLLVNQLSAEMVALAAMTLSRHLAISRTTAEDHLRRGIIPLDKAVDAKAELHLLALLASLGLTRQNRCAPNDQTLSIQLTSPADVPFLAQKLAAITGGQAGPVQHALQRPGGLILENLSPADVTCLRKQIRRHAGLKTAQSNANALSDLFVVGTLSTGLARALGRYLALFCAAPCRFSGALAAGLTLHQVKQLSLRFPDANLLGLDRAFQRFDLFLTGIGDLAAQDVAEFLSTRTNLSGAMVECVTPLQPLQIEKGLSRGATQQFRADYAAIGLQTCARLGAY